MIEIKVQLGQRSYPIRIGPWRDWDLRPLFGGGGAGAGKPSWTLVADRKVWPVWGQDLLSSLGSAGIEVSVLELDGGERAKNHENLYRIYDHLIAQKVRRDGTLAVFGGGVLGDIGGFAAATYQRGIRCVQIPTSLLAQVDSAIGGKTGLNYGSYKNLIGAFHQPVGVLISPEWLSSLPPREFRAGLAEVIKCGVIADPDLLGLLEEEDPDRILLSPRLEEVVARAVLVKSRIVERDEQDLGPRHVLNFGHTIGHALESATHFEHFLHGEAVALGMVGALQLSVELAGLPRQEATRIEALLLRYGLPVRTTGVDIEPVLSALEMDKKAQSEGGVWVLTGGIGRASVSGQVPTGRVRAAVNFILRQ